MTRKQGSMKNLSKTKFLLLLLLLIATLNSFGQVVFEKGYFIDNDDQRTECFIKNYGWKYSPTKIEFKLSESSDTDTANIYNIQEFGVSNLKYRRFSVQIDKSGENMANLSEDKEPIFTEETLFLKIIIEGEANLYSGGKPMRYFYSVNSSPLAQLIYKEYLTQDDEVATNNSYKSQLWKDLKCSCISLDDFKKTDFKRHDLIKIFEKYNECVDSDYTNYEKNRKKGKINLRIKPGLRWSTLSVNNAYNHALNVDFDGNLSFCFGMEAEFVFPFNKGKWAFTTETTYQSYNARTNDPITRLMLFTNPLKFP